MTEDKITLSFLGDIMCGNNRIRVDPELVDILERSDVVIGNLEGPITNAPSQKEKGQPLSTDPSVANLLEVLHLDIAILANNHIMDHGLEGLVDTQRYLNDFGIKHLGAGVNYHEASKPLIVHFKGLYLGFLAFCYDEGPMAGYESPGPCPLPSRSDIERKIIELRRSADLVIVSCHGGEEFFTVPWPKRRELFLDIARAGADIVFGHHAHVLQGFETVWGSLIIYGAGNFYLDIPCMHRHPLSYKGAVFNVRIDNSSFEISPTPIHVHKISNYVGIAEGRQGELIRALMNSACSCLEDRDLYIKEWRDQSFRRIIGDGGLLRKAYRFVRFLQRGRCFSHRFNSWFLERDHDILVGAFGYIWFKLWRRLLKRSGGTCSIK